MDVNLSNPLTRSTWLWGPNHSRLKLLFPGGGHWFEFASGAFPKLLWNNAHNKLGNKLCDVGQSLWAAGKRNKQKERTEQRKAAETWKKIKWKDTVVSSEPLWGAKIKCSLSAQEMHICCTANMDTREEGRNCKKLNSKYECLLRLAEHCAMFMLQRTASWPPTFAYILRLCEEVAVQ